MIPWLKIVAVLRVVFPLPAWADASEILVWWQGLGPAASELIAAIVERFRATGRVALALPDDTALVLADSGRCMTSDAAATEARLRAIPVEKWGDGKLLELLIQVLPYLIQILPYFLGPQPQPQPQPQPEPPVV